MKHFILLLLLAGAIGSFAQKAPVVTRFYYFRGTIDKFPVTFLLHRTNDDFTGSYFYQISASPIALWGKLDKKSMLTLKHESNDSKTSELIEGNFKDSVFSGTWQAKGKTLSFRVTESNDPSLLRFDYIWTSAKGNSSKNQHTCRISVKFPGKENRYGPPPTQSIRQHNW